MTKTYLWTYVSKFKAPAWTLHKLNLSVRNRALDQPRNNTDVDWSNCSNVSFYWIIFSKTLPCVITLLKRKMAAPMERVIKQQTERSTFKTTSFQKKTRSKLLSIPGTRPSVQNGQLLVSSGVTSLDFLLG